MKKEARIFIEDILDSIKKIEEYTAKEDLPDLRKKISKIQREQTLGF